MANQLIQDPRKLPVERSEDTNIAVYEKKLQERFSRSNFTSGLKALLDLKKEYDNLKLLFVNRDIQNTLLNYERVGKLTESLYLQGLGLLLQLLETSQQLSKPDIENLEMEIKTLGEDLRMLSPTSTSYSIITERISKNIASLSLVKSCRDRTDELINQVGLCKDSIREIRLELPELLGHKPKDEFDKIALELRTRIEFAQRVHEEYEKQGV